MLVRDEPAGLSPTFVLEQARDWRLPLDRVYFTPVGAGSFNWVGEAGGRASCFIKCDAVRSDADFARLRSTFLAVAALREEGLEFVVPPILDAVGDPVRRITPDWAMSIWPHLDGAAAGDGGWPRAGDRTAIVSLLGRLHRAPVPLTTPHWSPPEDLMSGSTSTLATDLGEVWDSGPYAHSAQRLVAAAAPMIERLARRYVKLVRQLAADNSPWVFTHGEPHSANVIITSRAQMLLIDWDSARVAPRERDLPQFVMPDDDNRALYAAAAGTDQIRSFARELFAIEWNLTEIRWYSDCLRAAHDDTADTRRVYDALHRYVGIVTCWAPLL